MQKSQIEFDFLLRAGPGSGSGRGRKNSARARATRRRARPQASRLAISPEAFESTRSDRGGGRKGLLEAAAALLATIAFGLGWAAVELERVESAGTGYDASQPSPIPGALWDLAAAHVDDSAGGIRARISGDAPGQTGARAGSGGGATQAGFETASAERGARRDEESDEWMDPTPTWPRALGNPTTPGRSTSVIGPERAGGKSER
ncbi:MAG: hypothetical protein GY910_26000 [bacterium]|nr:hypothetical protein [Deltaproteobacteria bacterium]MCP4908441.1 hypothetical protein [bacterium]